MRLIESEIFSRVHTLAYEHNLKQDSAKNNIKDGTLKLFDCIVSRYLKDFRKAIRLPKWADSDELPSFWTNNPELRNLCNCRSNKTIYNRIELLIQAGFVYKKWHGRQCDFELWINPWILFGEDYAKPEIKRVTEKMIVLKTEVSAPKRKILPPIISSEALEVYYNVSNRVLKSGENVENPNNLVENPILTNISELNIRNHIRNTISQIPTSETQEMAGGGGAVAPKNDNTSEQDVDSGMPNGLVTHEAPESLSTYKKSLTIAFWNTAKEKFYPDDYIAGVYVNKILNLIWSDIFGSWQGVDSIEAADKAYLFKLRMMEKAKNDATKRGWTSFLPPLNYFSVSFYQAQVKKGEKGSFWFTAEWIKKEDALAARIDKSRMLEKAIYSVTNQKPPKGLKDGKYMSQLSLSVYWRNRLTQLGDYDILKTYENRIIEIINLKSNPQNLSKYAIA